MTARLPITPPPAAPLTAADQLPTLSETDGGRPSQFGSPTIRTWYWANSAADIAFHFTYLNAPSACNYDTSTDTCFGCGPGSVVNGRCTNNVCLPPATDPCTSPTTIPPEGGAFDGTLAAGNSGATGTCSTASAGGAEVVYSWTPSTSGQATIATCDGTTNFDTVLYIREADCSTGTELDCNDDFCSGPGTSH